MAARGGAPARRSRRNRFIVLADGAAAGWACAAYALSTVVLFGTSATYHLGSWSLRTALRLRRMDHANIYLFSRNGAAVGTIVLIGGTAYTIGGLVHGLKRPDPWPRTFGFHEVFHTFTLIAWVCQYVAISLLAYR